jgi:hypothetical protein
LTEYRYGRNNVVEWRSGVIGRPGEAAEENWLEMTSSNGRADWRKDKNTNGSKGSVGEEKERSNKGRYEP